MATSLEAGARLGAYEVRALIGAGGMGEVYRATDTKLGRDVAIKVLPAEVAQDPERLARFEREAKLLASLNHPNIAHVYGFESATLPDGSGAHFLAMELVEGEDLAARLKHGPIPVGEAIEIAKQIAEALEEAHAKGIVHRDLKPANVKLTPDGKVKVLDFGLAKAYAGDAAMGASSADLSQSPTLAHSGTLAGVILGTAAYMPPEQASGRAVDKRADIWAFGVVLFEMLVGKRLFGGETASEVLASVIKDEPAWEHLPADCPPAIARLLRRCLRKRPRERLQDIGDARIELSDILAGVPEHVAPAGPAAAGSRTTERRRRTRERWAWAAVALVGGGLAALFAYLHFSQVPAVRPAAHFVLERPEGFVFGGFDPLALSPDGRLLAFTGIPPGGNQRVLWIRPLDSPAPRPLAGTEEADSPFWSPDGGSIAFFTGSELKRISLSGGAPQKLCALPLTGTVGGTWSPAGIIVFSTGGGSARLFVVAATGGEAKPLTPLDPSRGETGQFWPQFLPGGRQFLFNVGKRPESAGLHVASLDTPGERRRILPEVGRFLYAAPGRVLFVRGSTLFALPFDAKRLVAVGEAVPVAQSVDSFASAPNIGWFSASAGGVLAYMARGDDTRQLAWLDRRGARAGDVGKPGLYGQVKLSPDEKRLAVEIPGAGGYDLWVIELARGIASRVTSDPASERDPVWSPDGRELVFGLDRGGRRDLLRKNLLGNAPASVLLNSPVAVYPKSWSADGKSLVYLTEGGGEKAAWALPLQGDGKPELLLNTGFGIDGTKVSPDGRWLAYISDESGRWEVYVQPFRRAGERVRVSPDGGGQPNWRGDGKELFYLSPDGRIMAVDVQPGEASVDVGLPKVLFEAGRFEPELDDYAVTADGQRFLLKVPVENDAGRRIHVVINWPSLLQ